MQALSGFGKLKLAIFLEEIFDIELSNEKVEQFATVSDIVKYIGMHCFRNAEPLYLAEVA